MKESDLQKLLPSEAKKQLTEFFLKKIAGSKLNWYADPMYNYADALRDVPADVGSYVSSLRLECFEAAKKQYEQEHPKAWDNEKQIAYRE